MVMDNSFDRFFLLFLERMLGDLLFASLGCGRFPCFWNQSRQACWSWFCLISM